MDDSPKAYEGEWWLPSDEARKVGGILELGNKFELRLLGTFEEPDLPALGPTFDLTLLQGRSVGKAVTLLDGRPGPANIFFGGGSVVSVRTQVVLVGQYWLEAPEEAAFDKVNAELSNLLQWADQRAIRKEWNEDGTSTLTNTWLPSAYASIPGVTIKLGHGFDDKPTAYSISWTQSAGLIFELSSPLAIRDIDYKLIRPFRHLLSLASGVDSVPGPLRVGNKAYVEDQRRVWLDVYVYGRGKTYNQAELERPERMLFTLADVDFAGFIPQWYRLVDKLGITCDLLFSSNSPHVPFVSNKLFNLASAAEGMHQRLYPNTSLTFAQRLHQLIDHVTPAADPFLGDRNKWVALVKNLRNQFAHALQTNAPIENDVRKLSRLSATIDALLRLVLLREMGFSDNQCAGMTDRAPRWHYLKQVLPTELPEIF